MGKNNKEEHWYILVLTDEGPKFLTKLLGHKDAEWDMLQPPLELSEIMAKEIAFGLMVNFYMAYPVCAPIELSSQPYFYSKGKFNWEWNKEGEDEPDEKA